MSGEVMSPRLAQATEIAETLAEIALAAWHNRDAVAFRTKGPFDFVSETDTMVERTSRGLLDAAFAGENVFGEEFGGEIGDGAWIIDPIDGTRNFLRGSPLWGVSLGWAVNGRPLLGVVALPALNMIVSAQHGMGLFLNRNRVMRSTFGEDVRLVSFGDDLHVISSLAEGLRAKGWIGQAYRSTALSLCYAALGHIDGHIQNRVALWDMAAGLAICAEAGLECRFGGDASNHMWVRVGTKALLEDANAIESVTTESMTANDEDALEHAPRWNVD